MQLGITARQPTNVRGFRRRLVVQRREVQDLGSRTLPGAQKVGIDEGEGRVSSDGDPLTRRRQSDAFAAIQFERTRDAENGVEIDMFAHEICERFEPPLEIRGLGIVRMTYLPEVRLVLAVELGRPDGTLGRMPDPQTRHGLPLVHIDPRQASAPARVTAALRCVTGAWPLVAEAVA